MRTAIILALALTLVSGATFATNYTWIGGAVSGNFDCAAMWSVGGGAYPRNSSDNMILGTTGATLSFKAGSYNWGGLNITTGTLNLVPAANGSVYKFSADNGCTGDFIVNGRTAVVSGYLNSPNISTLDVAGNVLLTRPGNTNGAWNSTLDQHYWKLIMRGGTSGSPKVLDDNQPTHDYWQTVTIAPGAYVTTGTSANGNISHEANLVINGTITGGTWIMNNGNGGIASVSMGAGGAMTGGKIVAATITTGTFLFNTGTYYQIDTSTSGNPGDPPRRTFRLKGNVTTTSDFTYNSTTSSYDRNWQDILNTDNGSGNISNLTVNGNFRAGGNTNGPATPWTDVYYGIKANSATFTVAGNSVFDTYAYVKGDTSTWNFGGNVQFTSGFKFDNSDMSSTTVNVNKAGRPTLTFGNKLKLGNLWINPTGTGAHAHLTGDNVLLYGNFGVLGANSGFNMDCNASWLLFRGGKGSFASAETIELDNSLVTLRKLWLKQGSPTWVKLLSNATVSDNLDIDPNCILFTNGFTLTVNGGFDPGTYGPSSLAYTTHLGGLILVSGVPEPATLTLLGTAALAGFGWMRRRRIK